ncbi:U-box domain-containing protein 62-like [Bidens hawaiensis]|uniref:U-box domain-containing protein 62-like n=1 Tax=Bidens hawaiensis TaxID=980011 RepID=UPI00404B4744
MASHCPQNHHYSNRHNPPQFHHHKTTRHLTLEHQNHHFQPQSTTQFRRDIHEWDIRNAEESSSPSGDGSDTDGNDTDDDVNISDNDNNNNKNKNKNAHKINVIGNDIINVVRSSSTEDQYQNAITVVDPTGELYYSQLYNRVEGSGVGFKGMLVDNGCGFSGRKDYSNSGGSGESLRAILSDPLTGALMDDAMILPCGHSFGSGGMQHVMRMKACYTCSHPVSETSFAPNLSLRSAVIAFLREEELQTNRPSKRRNKLDQDKSNYCDLALMDQIRGRGVQFPFSVSERVIIKGNKRTPSRFVGCEAIVTTQCLNGWYVVKTLDNAESVKLQYRSLAKIPDSQPSIVASTKIVTPNWL